MFSVLISKDFLFTQEAERDYLVQMSPTKGIIYRKLSRLDALLPMMLVYFRGKELQMKNLTLYHFIFSEGNTGYSIRNR